MLNLSLSASNMCLKLIFRAWAVYQSCRRWKLGSCVSPMMSREGGSAVLLCDQLTCLSGTRQTRELAFEGHPGRFHTCSSYKSNTIFMTVTHTHTPPQGDSAGWRHRNSNTVLCSALCSGLFCCCTYFKYFLAWS